MAQLNFLIHQLFSTVPKPTTSFRGKTVIVTGANTGLGLEAARHFANLDATTVILAVRSMTKGESAKNDIEASTGRKDAIKVWHLDMSSYQSVLDFVARVKKSLGRVDAVVLNAGIGPMKWEVMERDESTLTVNVVSTILLALALLPVLETTEVKYQTKTNMTVVASAMHAFARFPERNAPAGHIFAKLNTKSQDMQERYNVSKLLVILAVRAIAEKTLNSPIQVTVNCVCPGFCHSDITRDVSGTLYVITTVMKAVFARSTEKGSRTLVHAASRGPESHGQFLSNCQVTCPSSFVLSPEGRVAQERVWEELVQKLETIEPTILRDIQN